MTNKVKRIGHLEKLFLKKNENTEGGVVIWIANASFLIFQLNQWTTQNIKSGSFK
jgi:hypothetical protein